jgi:hypothetical protein
MKRRTNMRYDDFRDKETVKKWYDINDGTRSLIESIVVPEVSAALQAFKNGNGCDNAVLIGGLALSFYGLPRYTQDIDLLFVSFASIPHFVEGFKKVREHAFEHKKTNVIIEVLDSDFLKIPQHLVETVFDTATLIDGIHIASKSGLIALKLQRFSRQDQADIEQLLKMSGVDMTPFNLSQVDIDKLKTFE